MPAKIIWFTGLSGSGKTTLSRELNKKLTLNLPIQGPKTLNGLILEFFEDIPEPNTSFKISNITFQIINAQNKNVKSVKIYNNIKKSKI